jgi:hypothetical protein
MEISFIDSDLSDDLYYNHGHLLSQLPLGRRCAVDADRDAVDKRERLRTFCEDWRKHIAYGQDGWLVGLRGQDLHLRLEVMSLSYCPMLLPRHKSPTAKGSGPGGKS